MRKHPPSLCVHMLPNQTWVCSPTVQQSQFTHARLWWRKVQHLCAGHQTRNTGSSCSKDPNSLMTFRESFLKATFGVRAEGCMTFFWLVGGEVTGWCFRNLNHQPLVPANLGSKCLWLACSHHPPPGWSGAVSSCRTTQRFRSDCSVYPWGGTRTLFYHWTIAITFLV